MDVCRCVHVQYVCVFQLTIIRNVLTGGTYVLCLCACLCVRVHMCVYTCVCVCIDAKMTVNSKHKIELMYI